jgi:hypothetical protein
MPGQYKEGTVSMLFRLPVEIKEQLQQAVNHLRQVHPGSNYSVNSLVLEAVIEKLRTFDLSNKAPRK